MEVTSTRTGPGPSTILTDVFSGQDRDRTCIVDGHAVSVKVDRLRLVYTKDHDGGINSQPISIGLENVGPISADDTRKLPWGKVLRAATEQVRLVTHYSGDQLDQARTAATDLNADQAKKAGRPRLPDSHYDDIATEYRELLRQGEHAPARRISDRRGVNYNTVRRWIAEARKRHYLEPGTPGKPG